MYIQHNRVWALTKIRKWLVCTISWCVFKLIKYGAKHITTGRGAPPWGAPKAHLVCVCVASYVSSLQIHQGMVYTSHFLSFSRPNPGGGVYIRLKDVIKLELDNFRSSFWVRFLKM